MEQALHDLKVKGAGAGTYIAVGCLAIGDPAIEELFLLVAETSPENVTVLLCPSDPAAPFARAAAADLPQWIDEVDAALDAELRRVGLR